MIGKVQQCPHCRIGIIPMADRCCPSCRRHLAEVAPFRMRPVGDGGDSRESLAYDAPLSIWKPFGIVVFLYSCVMILAAATGTIDYAATLFVGLGLLSFLVAKVWFYAVVAEESPVGALACLFVPFVWIIFAKEHWIRTRWPICCGVLGVMSMILSGAAVNQ